MPGDSQRGNVFADAWVGRMAPLDAIAWANDLRDLMQHPGWVKVQEVLAAQAEHATKSVAVDPRLAALAIADDPLKAAVRYADAAGQVKGLQSLSSLMDTVLNKVDEMQAIIEAEGD